MNALQIANLIDGLKYLSNMDLQKRSCLYHEDVFVSSFSELICQIFDDTGLQDLIDEKSLQAHFSNDVCDEIYLLDEALSRVNKSLSSEELIESAEMDGLRSAAKKLFTHLAELTNGANCMSESRIGDRPDRGCELEIGMLYHCIKDYRYLVDDFLLMNPGIDVHLHAFQPDQLIEALTERKIDAGITLYTSVPDNANLCHFTIREEPMVVILPSGHPLSAYDSLPLKALCEHLFVFVGKDIWHEKGIMHYIGKQGLAIKNRVFADRIETLPYAINKYNGVSLLPNHLAYSTSWDNIVYKPLSEPYVLDIISLVYQADNKNSLLPILIDYIVGHDSVVLP